MSTSTSTQKPKTTKHHSPRNPKKDRKVTGTKGASHSKTEVPSKPAKNVDGNKSSSSLGAGDSKTSGRREISICVLDDCKNTSETFVCEYDVLVNKMPYFKDCLDAEPEGELTISVHCDIVVFKKIMDYISIDTARDSKKFKIDPKYAIHLLVSADFLQMSALVEECLSYCHRHMNSIIESNCPVGALNEALLTRLALLFSHREVEALKDPGGKIKEKLCKILLEKLLKPECGVSVKGGIQKLFKCNVCDQVFATKLQAFVSCKTKKATIGPRGELVYTHKRDINFDIDRHLEDLYKLIQNWRKIYWRMWGLVNSLRCITCGLEFACSEFTRCRFHKEPITFPATEPSQNVHEMGTFPCCGEKSWKFDPLNPLLLSSGCAYRNHSVNSVDRASDVFQDMLTYYDLICLPQATQAPMNENQGLNRIVPCFSERAVAQWSHATGLEFLIKTGSKQSISSDGSGSFTTKSSESLTVGLPRKELKQHTVFTSVLSAVGQAYGAPDAKQVWKPGGSLWHNQDAVREHDSRQMDLMMAQFQKMQCLNRIRQSSPRKP